MWISESTDYSHFELDEIFWFICERKSSETGVNAYVMTMISRKPRQIVGFAVDTSVNSLALQKIADSTNPAKTYNTDGCPVYLDVDFLGKHNRNMENKKDTHIIESINSDLRHYISGLRRRSKIFYRSLETFRAVLSVFIDAYNKFGEAKMKHRSTSKQKYYDPPFSILDFL